MRHSATIILSLLVGLGLSGCAASGSSRNKKYKRSFSTQVVRTNFRIRSSSLGGNTPVSYRVQVHCRTLACTTPTTILSFSVEPGSNDVYLNNFNLNIYAGDEDYHWESPGYENIRRSRSVNGRFLSVSLTQTQLKQIAESKNVNGNIAGNSFKWSYKNRKPLRNLLQKMK